MYYKQIPQKNSLLFSHTIKSNNLQYRHNASHMFILSKLAIHICLGCCPVEVAEWPTELEYYAFSYKIQLSMIGRKCLWGNMKDFSMCKKNTMFLALVVCVFSCLDFVLP